MDDPGPGSVPQHVGDRKVMALVDTGWSGQFLFTRKAASELGLPTTRESPQGKTWPGHTRLASPAIASCGFLL